MQVTCQICKSKIERDIAYKRVVGKVNKYYCSEEEWQAEEDKKKKAAADKDRVYYLICDIMGEQEIINTILYKEWQIWNRVADNEKISKYLEENYDYLVSVIGKLSSSEFAKIRYLSAIIKDKIKEFVPKVEVKQYERQMEICGVGPINYKPKETRRGLDFLEE